jgi:hypothetical protein
MYSIENIGKFKNENYFLNIHLEPSKAFLIPDVRKNLKDILEGKITIHFDLKKYFIKFEFDRFETFKNHIVSFCNEHNHSSCAKMK